MANKYLYETVSVSGLGIKTGEDSTFGEIRLHNLGHIHENSLG